MPGENVAGIIADSDFHIKRHRHRISGDIIMCRPDSPGGEDMIPGGPEFIDCPDDLLMDIADKPHLGEIKPVLPQPGSQERISSPMTSMAAVGFGIETRPFVRSLAYNRPTACINTRPRELPVLPAGSIRSPEAGTGATLAFAGCRDSETGPLAPADARCQRIWWTEGRVRSLMPG